MKICSGNNCEKQAIARGFCNTHWLRWRKYGDPEFTMHKTVCTIADCGGKHVARGFCSRHFEQERRKSGYKAKKEATPKYRYTHCLNYAKTRNLSWTIEFEDYEKLLKNNCHYCDGPLPATRVGLDRKDSFAGYFLENVVPCCRYCNQVKSNIFTYEEFLRFSKTDLFKTILNRLHNRS